ncbi:MAG: 50S ribosomal protein L4 [Candidatus Zixiibacteriota bacterium]
MKVKVYNQDGAEVGSVELQDAIFGIEPNEGVVHQYVVNYLARQRQGTADSKGRAEVSGGGKKPYRQKGTGQARAGTSRTPLKRGGGTVHGPEPRSYGSNFPKQMKRLAIQSVFSAKAKADKVRVIDSMTLSEIKTRKVLTILDKLAIKGKRYIILDEGQNEKATLSCRNIPNVSYKRAALANGYELLNADYVILTKAGLEKVHEVFA